MCIFCTLIKSFKSNNLNFAIASDDEITLTTFSVPTKILHFIHSIPEKNKIKKSQKKKFYMFFKIGRIEWVSSALTPQSFYYSFCSNEVLPMHALIGLSFSQGTVTCRCHFHFVLEEWFPTFSFPGTPSLILKISVDPPPQLKLQLCQFHCFIA